MKNFSGLSAFLAICSLTSFPSLLLGADAAGHWEGSIQLPGTVLAVRVDIERAAGGSWSGTIDIPAQGLRGFALASVSVDREAVAFGMAGIPGDPKFSGKLESAGAVISGQFTQGGQSFPFKLERKSKTTTPGETPTKGLSGRGLAGHWQGSLTPVPILELRLVLELTNAPGGGVGGVMISLDQGNVRLPITSLVQSETNVHFETKTVSGVFDGKMSQDGAEISGTWKQGTSTSPLIFKRLKEAPRLSRTQDPVKPYGYEEEEVAIPSVPGVVLAGTLTSPKGAGTHPAVVLISGSGPQDRHEALMGHRPFLVLADHLTRQGVIVLRLDDRGIGKSTGDFTKATDRDFVEDALAVVKWLRARKGVGQIGLVGHSEGGIVAPQAAIKSPEVAFIVLLAGVGVPMEQLLVRQAKDISRVMGVSDELIAKNAASQREIFRLLKEENQKEILENKLRQLVEEQTAALTPEQKTALGMSEDVIKIQMNTVCTPWFRELLLYDPRPVLGKVKCPVLALNGDKDLQVAASENLSGIEQSLRAGGNKRFKIIALPGLNHLFQQCQTGAVSEYAQVEETFNPQALKIISDWILETAGESKAPAS